VLVAILAIGATCHFWHHLTDADCDRMPIGHASTCSSCVGLHGAIVAAALPVAPAPPLSKTNSFLLIDCSERHQGERNLGSPRAPPLA
jgi:hypothetical protein